MSAEASGWVYRYSPYSGTTFSVHLAVADSVNDMHHQEFWMALDNVATKARCSLRSVREAMHQLVAHGWLELLHQSEGRHPSKYRFCFIEAPVVYESRNGNPAKAAASNPAIEPGSDCRVTRQPLPSNPAEVAGHPNQIPNGSQKGERAKKKTAWHTVPETELLTPKRRETARAVGLHPARTAQEWQKFSNYHFPKPKVDVDATWRNWCVGALDDAWTPPPDPKPPVRKEPDPPYYRKVRAGASPVDTVTPGPTRLGDILTKVAPHPPEDDTLGL